jgi:hypothetical protein
MVSRTHASAEGKEIANLHDQLTIFVKSDNLIL